MSTDKLTEIQKILIYGLMQAKMGRENATLLTKCLKEEKDQITMIKYLLKNPNPKPLKLMKEFGLILQKRDEINKDSEN